MLIPKREGKCCDAVVRHIERARASTRTHVSDPETTGGDGCVDLLVTVGELAYALEHTRVQPFPNRIGVANAYHIITARIEEWFPTPLPGAAFYELHIPPDIRLPGRGKEGERRMVALRDWIISKVDVLHYRAPDRPPPASAYFDVLDCIRGRPSGWDCEFTIARSRDGFAYFREIGSLSAYIGNPDDLKGAFMEEVRRAFRGKCPKLARHKKQASGDRTVLVMECMEMAPGYDLYLSKELSSFLGECSGAPDDIFLVCPDFPSWQVWVVKRDGIHWPDDRIPMPHKGYYEFPAPRMGGHPAKMAETSELSFRRREPPLELRPYFLKEDELEDLKST